MNKKEKAVLASWQANTLKECGVTEEEHKDNVAELRALADYCIGRTGRARIQ